MRLAQTLCPTPINRSLSGKQDQWQRRLKGARGSSTPISTLATSSCQWRWRLWEWLAQSHMPSSGIWQVGSERPLGSPWPISIYCNICLSLSSTGMPWGKCRRSGTRRLVETRPKLEILRELWSWESGGSVREWCEGLTGWWLKWEEIQQDFKLRREDGGGGQTGENMQGMWQFWSGKCGLLVDEVWCMEISTHTIRGLDATT